MSRERGALVAPRDDSTRPIEHEKILCRIAGR